MFFNRQFVIVAVVASFLTIAGLQLDAARAGVSIPQPVFGTGSALSAAASLSFDGTVAWVRTAGYVAIFLAMLVEGPIITAAASFGAALGYFNIWIIFVLSILGDLVADLIYYAVGYFARAGLIERFGHRVGLSRARLKKLERTIHTHPTKALLLIKLAPVLPTPGLMLVGTMRMPLGQYTSLSTLIILPKVIIFMALGYYFGAVYDSLAQYAQAGEFFIVIAVALLAAAYFAYQQVSARISLRLQLA